MFFYTYYYTKVFLVRNINYKIFFLFGYFNTKMKQYRPYFVFLRVFKLYFQYGF